MFHVIEILSQCFLHLRGAKIALFVFYGNECANFISVIAYFILCHFVFVLVSVQYSSFCRLLGWFNVLYQSLSYREEKAFLLWTHITSFTWFGSSKFTHQRSASPKCTPCIEECLYGMFEMYTFKC